MTDVVFFGALAVLVLSVVGLIVLGAIWLHSDSPPASPHREALSALRRMQGDHGPRVLP